MTTHVEVVFPGVRVSDEFVQERVGDVDELIVGHIPMEDSAIEDVSFAVMWRGS
jgi:hypothetical protein